MNDSLDNSGRLVKLSMASHRGQILPSSTPSSSLFLSIYVAHQAHLSHRINSGADCKREPSLALIGDFFVYCSVHMIERDKV